MAVAGLTKNVAACSSLMSSGTGTTWRAFVTVYSAQLPMRSLMTATRLPFRSQPSSPPPRRLDDADALEAGRRGEARLQAVLARDVHEVRRVDRAGEHPHQHLAACAAAGRARRPRTRSTSAGGPDRSKTTRFTGDSAECEEVGNAAPDVLVS